MIHSVLDAIWDGPVRDAYLSGRVYSERGLEFEIGYALLSRALVTPDALRFETSVSGRSRGVSMPDIVIVNVPDHASGAQPLRTVREVIELKLRPEGRFEFADDLRKMSEWCRRANDGERIPWFMDIEPGQGNTGEQRARDGQPARGMPEPYFITSDTTFTFAGVCRRAKRPQESKDAKEWSALIDAFDGRLAVFLGYTPGELKEAREVEFVRYQ